MGGRFNFLLSKMVPFSVDIRDFSGGWSWSYKELDYWPTFGCLFWPHNSDVFQKSSQYILCNMPCRIRWPIFTFHIHQMFRHFSSMDSIPRAFFSLWNPRKTTILPWSTILPTSPCGLQSVSRSPRLALLTLVMLIPRYLHNVGQYVNKKTHGIPVEMLKRSVMFRICLISIRCRNWSMKSIITQIEIIIHEYFPSTSPYPFFQPRKRNSSNIKKPNHQIDQTLRNPTCKAQCNLLRASLLAYHH